jgi:uncharacterized protein
MRIFAISDLHLFLGGEKPMDIFGPAWENHAETIKHNWDAQVSDSDLVLVAGDTSWAMRLNDAMPDLEYLGQRPGRKIVIRGNHDYWWKRESTRRLQGMVDPSITLLQGQALIVDGVGITGTRGWAIDAEGGTEEQNRKILDRELRYLEAGLAALPASVSLRIVILHFPPYSANLEPNEFLRVAKDHSVDMIVYGHLHLPMSEHRLEGDIDGVRLHLAAVDSIGFEPSLIVP